MTNQRQALVDESERQWLLAEADRLITFAEKSLLPSGGFAMLDDNGEPDDQPLELYVNCRMTHVFSIAEGLHHPGARRYLEAGINAIDGRFADRENGGWFHSVGFGTDAGAVDDTKAAYDHAFVMLAGSSGVARRAAGASELLGRAIQVFDDHFWDDTEGLVRESFSADWSHSEPYRGVNANMHTVEALMACADATSDQAWLQRALRIADRVVNGWARGNGWRIPEHFDENWQPQPQFNSDTPADPFRPFGATVGHGMEWARLCLQLNASLGSSTPGWLVDAAVNLYARAKEDGWARDGADGFVYTVDWDGEPVVHERMHWVAAEATAAAAALHRMTDETGYSDDFHTWWDYIRTYLVDPVHGSWHHELSRENKPSATVWKGKPDVYHALQACLIPLLPLHPAIAFSITTM